MEKERKLTTSPQLYSVRYKTRTRVKYQTRRIEMHESTRKKEPLCTLFCFAITKIPQLEVLWKIEKVIMKEATEMKVTPVSVANKRSRWGNEVWGVEKSGAEKAVWEGRIGRSTGGLTNFTGDGQLNVSPYKLLIREVTVTRISRSQIESRIVFRKKKSTLKCFQQKIADGRIL